jgi:hypothetical protein
VSMSTLEARRKTLDLQAVTAYASSSLLVSVVD